MRLVKSTFPFLFIIITISALVTTTSIVKGFREKLPPDLVSRHAYHIDNKLIKVVSGEFKGLLADYLLLKAAVIDGGEPEKLTFQDWQAIYILYRQSMELDPYFYTTAYYIQGNLVWQEGMVENAMALLKISESHRVWDWNPKWFLAFDYANFLNDKKQAAKYLYKAAKMPDALPIFAIIAARFEQGRGDTLASIAMLKAMYDQTDNESFRRVLEKRIEAHTGVYQLEQAIHRYELKFGKVPEGLEDLVADGILQVMPKNPFCDKYAYDPRTGKVDYGIRR